jgi:peptide/nickel transport system substrate-binding protein
MVNRQTGDSLVGTGWTDVVAYIENLKETAKDAGFDIQLDTMPNSSYWDKWTETTVGVTPWTHRPLAVKVEIGRHALEGARAVEVELTSWRRGVAGK